MQKTKTLKIAFLIPFYNEHFSVLKRTILRIFKASKKFPQVETFIFAYDDGSTNKTFYKLAGVFKNNRHIILIRNPENNGQGYALKMLAKTAKAFKFDYYITFDADGQHNPKTALRMAMFAYKNKYDVVLGSRYIKGTPNYMPTIRKLAVYLARFLLVPFLGKYYTDIQNGLRVFNKKAINLLTKIKLFRMEHSLEILYLIAKNKKLKVAEFPTVIKYTKYATTTNHGEASNTKILARGFYIVKNFLAYRLLGLVPDMYSAVKKPHLDIFKTLGTTTH